MVHKDISGGVNADTPSWSDPRCGIHFALDDSVVFGSVIVTADGAVALLSVGCKECVEVRELLSLFHSRNQTLARESIRA